MKDVKDTKWLIAGGTGAVGEGIVRKLLEKGAKVIVPVRSAEKEAALRDYILESEDHNERLVTVEASYGSPEGAKAFSENLHDNHSDIDVAVASLGGWWYGKPLHEMAWEEWQEVIDNNLNSHYHFMQAVYPLMVQRKEGLYIMINGGASEYPVPGSGPVSMMAAAQKMMAKVLAAENRSPSTLRVHSLVLSTPIVTRINEDAGKPDWITSAEVGEYLCQMYRGKTGHRDEPVHHLRNAKDIIPE